MRIIAENLTFNYNKKTKFGVKALDKVSLTVEDGDFYGIIGHTGSGKSTFIQHLNALIPVEEGKLLVGEYDLSAGVKKDKKRLKKLRSKVGMVFQYPEYQLFAETVYDDIAFGYKNFYENATPEEIKTAVLKASDSVGIDRELLARSPFELSGGQKRRVAIAGVIVTSPEVLVLDEPVAGLDPIGKKELMRLLHTLKNGVCKTVIIVSHDMDEVCENCNKIAVFSEGKVVMEGTPKEVFKDDKRLLDLRLDVPITRALQKDLSSVGVEIDSDYTMDDFVKKVADYYKNI